MTEELEKLVKALEKIELHTEHGDLVKLTRIDAEDFGLAIAAYVSECIKKAKEPK